MSNAIDYVEKSDRRNVSRGHNRWLRAGINAVLRPNSKAAQLYRGRVALAESIARQIRSAGTVDRGYRHLSQYNGVTTKYYTCSTYCAAMCAQLEVSPTAERVLRYLTGDDTPEQRGLGYKWYHRPDFAVVLKRAEMTRVVKCQCCGSTIKPR